MLLGIAATAFAAAEFLPAGSCAFCHSRPGVLTRARMGHHELWRDSVMSFAARDPYWRARVENELRATGPRAAAIEDKCLRCHAPAGQYPARSAGRLMRFADLTVPGGEGVTCTVCHRIDADGLGSPRSFTGGFLITADEVIFGPHDRPFVMPMLHHTGFEPVASKHISEAALCGSCHTLLIGDSFAEQATYLEWLAGVASKRGATCQSCHVPALRDDSGSMARDYIAHRPPGGAFPPTRPRSPIGLHTFTGGNAQLLETLADRDPEQAGGLRERAEATRRFLRTALRLEARAEATQAHLDVYVTVVNLTGHKLPTGIPGRRLWLHLTASGADGRVLFESGAWDPATGELKMAGGPPVHRHHIREAGQAMVYEAVIENAAGELTNLLTTAARFRKDNRLLPEGFAAPSALIRPAGVIADSDFVAGSDTVRYTIPLRGAGAPIRISVEACYQSIRPEDVAALVGADSFVNAWAKHRGPVIVREVELVVDEKTLRGARGAHLAGGNEPKRD